MDEDEGVVEWAQDERPIVANPNPVIRDKKFTGKSYRQFLKCRFFREPPLASYRDRLLEEALPRQSLPVHASRSIHARDAERRDTHPFESIDRALSSGEIELRIIRFRLMPPHELGHLRKVRDHHSAPVSRRTAPIEPHLQAL